MKTNIIIVLLTISFFSCKKQRLNKEKEVLVGEWVLSHSISTSTSQYGSGRWTKTIYPDPNEPLTTLLFKKNGKVFFNHNGKEQKLKMNFRDNKTGEGYFENELSDLSQWNDSVYAYLGQFHRFVANVHFITDYKHPIELFGCVNQDMLVIISSEAIMSNRSYETLKSYSNYFIRK